MSRKIGSKLRAMPLEVKREPAPKSLKEAIARAPAADKHVSITPLNLRQATLRIKSIRALVQNKFSAKSQRMIAESQKAGPQPARRKARRPKDFNADYESAQHLSVDGWHGHPAAAFRNAMIDACPLANFKMTTAKKTLFVLGEGYDSDGRGLVRIHGKPRMTVLPVKNTTGVVDMRARPMFDDWWADVTVEWDADQFSSTDIVNLLNRAGFQIGIGDGRPFSKESAGQDWGRFQVEAS